MGTNNCDLNQRSQQPNTLRSQQLLTVMERIRMDLQFIAGRGDGTARLSQGGSADSHQCRGGVDQEVCGVAAEDHCADRLGSNLRSLMAMQQDVPPVFDMRSNARTTASAAYSLAHTACHAQRNEPDSTRPAAIRCTSELLRTSDCHEGCCYALESTH